MEDGFLISIITPTLNESQTLPNRASELQCQHGEWEWIVADGNSADDTVAVARTLGARVVEAERGRGTQLNAGAKVARGDILLFLHADTQLPPDALVAVRRAVRQQGAMGGNFSLRFDGKAFFSGVLAAQAYLRQRLTGVYFGDSVIFVRRDVFEDLGGFPDQPLLEDFEFSRRLEAFGQTVCLPQKVRTSARRFEGREFRTLFTWGVIHVLYRAGIPAERLASLYGHSPRTYK